MRWTSWLSGAGSRTALASIQLPTVREPSAVASVVVARALRGLAALLDAPSSPQALPSPAVSEPGARCAGQLFAGVCSSVGTGVVGVSCTNGPEAPTPPSALVEAPRSVLEGPVTEPSRVPPPDEGGIQVVSQPAPTLRSSGVSGRERCSLPLRMPAVEVVAAAHLQQSTVPPQGESHVPGSAEHASILRCKGDRP
jgi:hypothetical protein